jgi:hypothetical protein
MYTLLVAISALAVLTLGNEVQTAAFAAVPPAPPIPASMASIIWWEGQDSLPRFLPDNRLAVDVVVLPGNPVPYSARELRATDLPKWSLGPPSGHQQTERDFAAFVTAAHCHAKFLLPMQGELKASIDAFKVSAWLSPDDVAFVRFVNHDGTPDVKRGMALCRRHNLWGVSQPILIGTRLVPESPFAIPEMIIPLRGGVDAERHLAVTEHLNEQFRQRPADLEAIGDAFKAMDRRERAMEAICDSSPLARMVCRLMGRLKK